MKEQYRSFGNNLRALSPDGAQNVEVTVPNRLTGLFLVNYGRNDEGRFMLALTDTLLRVNHLSGMDPRDIHYLGKLRPEDCPTATTTAFSCYWEDAGMVAEPIAILDHGRGTYEEIHSHDRDFQQSGTNIPLLRRVIADTAANFERFRNMGFFGPKAISTPREIPEIGWQRINAEISVDRRMTLECWKFIKKATIGAWNSLSRPKINDASRINPDRTLRGMIKSG